jgi:predicted RNA-binding protein with PUA-like domain
LHREEDAMRESADEPVQGFYLLKTEPDDYGWDDLDRDGSTVWSGVRNYTALKVLRDMREGDLAFLYHTGRERRIVGIARVASDPYPDPEADEAGMMVVDVEPVEALERPVTLAEIKGDPAFRDFDLVRLPRLSVMPVEPRDWERIVARSRQTEVEE